MRSFAFSHTDGAVSLCCSINMSCVLQYNSIAKDVAAEVGGIKIIDLYGYVEKFCQQGGGPGWPPTLPSSSPLAGNYTACAIQSSVNTAACQRIRPETHRPGAVFRGSISSRARRSRPGSRYDIELGLFVWVCLSSFWEHFGQYTGLHIAAEATRLIPNAHISNVSTCKGCPHDGEAGGRIEVGSGEMSCGDPPSPLSPTLPNGKTQADFRPFRMLRPSQPNLCQCLSSGTPSQRAMATGKAGMAAASSSCCEPSVAGLRRFTCLS